MDIRIKTTDYSMPLEVAEYLDHRIAAIEKLLSEDAKNARCEVEVGRAIGHPQQGDVWRAEFIVIREGERSVAEATGESVNAAIDLAKDEILEQLRKNKERNQTLAKRMGGRFKQWTRWGE